MLLSSKALVISFTFEKIAIFSNVNEITNALEDNNISIHSKIICQFNTVDEKGNKIIEKYKSTAGRFLLAETLPKHHKIKFALTNRLLTKKAVSEIIDIVYRYCGQKKTVIFCDSIKELGFKHAFKALKACLKPSSLILSQKITVFFCPQYL